MAGNVRNIPRATIIALALSALASVAADAPNISRRELPQYR